MTTGGVTDGLFIINVPEGREVIDYLTVELAHLDVWNAAVVSVIGALEHCVLSTMRPDNGQDSHASIPYFTELSGNGEVLNGVPHLHVNLGEPIGPYSGHMVSGTVMKGYFVHVYVLQL